jgi:NAD(P)-dependent dehydrogenase (short-subunit alcohol dehydrogenase family)
MEPMCLGSTLIGHNFAQGDLPMTSSTLTALITAGTSGIGRAAANKLARLGIYALVVGRSLGRGKKTVEEIRAAGGKADFIASDLRDAASAREVARKALELGNGEVNILVNNAGVYPFGPTHEMTEEQFDRVFSLNVKAPYFLVAELAPRMAKTGKGAIVKKATICSRCRASIPAPISTDACEMFVENPSLFPCTPR